MWCSFSRRSRSVPPLHKAARPGTRDCDLRDYACATSLRPQTRRAESLRCTPLPVYVGPRRSGQSLPPVPAATALRRPDSHVGRTEGWCLNSTVSASSRTPFCLASAASRRSPAAAYGLAPYAICVRLQPRLVPSLHPPPNSTGHLMNARFSVSANFNAITRPKDAAGHIYIFILWAQSCCYTPAFLCDTLSGS